MENCIDTKCPSALRARFESRGFRAAAAPRAAARPRAEVPRRSAEPAMLMLVRDIGPLVTRVSGRLERCLQRRRERRELMMLDDRMLRDIGVSRADAEREFREPWWRD